MIRLTLLPGGRASRPFHARYMAAMNTNSVPVYDRWSGQQHGYAVRIGPGKRYTTRNRAILYGAGIR